MVLLTGIFLGFLPERAVSEQPDNPASSIDSLPHLSLGILILLAFLLFSLADLSVWLFSERMGDRVGLSPTTIGLLLGVGTGIGLAGPVIAIFVHVRYGRILPFTAGLLLLARFHVRDYPRSQRADLYRQSVALEPDCLFLYPYFLGALSEIDTSGTWTILSAPVVSFGLAVGPIITGVLAAEKGYETVGWFAGILTLAALGLMLVVLNQAVFRNVQR